MKITGYTKYGYLVELEPAELAKLTGNFADNRHSGFSRYGAPQQENHAIGTELHVSPTWDHVQKLLENEPQRQRIAESLRAAATLIEHTPSPITFPQEPASTEAA